MNRSRKNYIKSCEISIVESLQLGGYQQKIAMEGKSKELPIVISLHGGPGSPIPFSVGCRGLFPDFTDRFIMVYWDQLGCGINNFEIDNHFTIEHFVTMTIDLIKELKSRFPENKIYLFGMSWGSILALYSAIRVPELLSGVVTCGQVVTSPMLSDNAFEAVEASKAPDKKKKFARELHSKGTDITINEMMEFSKIIRKYTNGYNNKSSKPAPVGRIIKGLLTSPDYSFKDFIAIIKNGYMKNESLLREMGSKDLSQLFNEITIPYLIFQGETDIVTDTKSIVKLVDELNNPNVSCHMLPNVGHFPTEIAMNQIFEKLIDMTSK